MPEPPQILLPFAEREYVDMKRACRILGLGWTAVYRMAHLGMIDLVEYRARGWKKVRYQSLIDLCDRLREKYAITDRRPKLSHPCLRHRDEDLLPFPLSDTVNTEEARTALGIRSFDALSKLIEEGRFDAYQFTRDSDWRISRISLRGYIDKIMRPRNAADDVLSLAENKLSF